jgi:hypothetical protein
MNNYGLKSSLILRWSSLQIKNLEEIEWRVLSGRIKEKIFEKLTNVRLYLYPLAIERLPTGFEID